MEISFLIWKKRIMSTHRVFRKMIPLYVKGAVNDSSYCEMAYMSLGVTGGLRPRLVGATVSDLAARVLTSNDENKQHL